MEPKYRLSREQAEILAEKILTQARQARKARAAPTVQPDGPGADQTWMEPNPFTDPRSRYWVFYN